MRLRHAVSGVCLVLLCSALMAGEHKRHGELRDLFFGEALFYAYQDDFFAAITRLDAELAQYYSQDEPALDPLHFHRDEAEFSVGDLELSYRMHRRAGRALHNLLEGKVDQATRNEAAFRLARIYFQKGQPADALHAIERITGEIPESIRADEAFLRAQIYLATGRFADAVVALRALQGEASLAGFAAYNLGIALIRSGREAEGLAQLDRVGGMAGDDPAVLALKDKANLALGYRMLEGGSAGDAKTYLERVRLEGPFSNKALLGAGWADVAQGRFERALVPWTILHDRQTIDASVQESMLAVPYAYGKLDVYGKAAVMYGHAMETFAVEIERLDASVKSIRQGRFLSALLREEAKKDRYWLLNLRDLPDAPETRYIMELMASDDFQESLKNYQDLAGLRRQLAAALSDLAAYEELIEIRRRYYVPLLPAIDEQFRNMDARIQLRVEQKERLSKRLHAMLISRRPEYLARGEEHKASEALTGMERFLADNPAYASAEIAARIRRLKGVLHWQVESQYDDRLTAAYTHIHELDGVIDAMNHRYQTFVRARHAATQSYEGYDTTIRRLRTRHLDAQARLNGIMARQGRVLEALAIDELERRRKRLEEYQIKARFALADSYDRATKAQYEGDGK